ncbi:MAG: hypothetical protein A2096_12590 [Spirochaetes bacterium GWF1_41_5]|nr:MAG: hypothetical protein A2096_12590 [Spirochaetes bacterium GWF1_41_5]HBE01000.1 hypothetical protein [Spirochaetia bacterium]
MLFHFLIQSLFRYNIHFFYKLYHIYKNLSRWYLIMLIINSKNIRRHTSCHSADSFKFDFYNEANAAKNCDFLRSI